MANVFLLWLSINLFFSYLLFKHCGTIILESTISRTFIMCMVVGTDIVRTKDGTCIIIAYLFPQCKFACSLFWNFVVKMKAKCS